MKAIIILFFLYYGVACFGINPKKEYISTPKEYQINYEEVSIKNKDIEICIWISQPKENLINNKNLKTIILAYGDYGNMSYYLPYINFYTKLGFRVVSFDYRGFGKSSPFFIDQNILFYDEFAEDLKNVISYCKKKMKTEKIGIVSLSMGTILTCIALQDERIEFIIAEGCVYDVYDIVERLNKIKNKHITLKKDYDLPRKWSLIKSRILILVANKDSITTYKDSQNIIIQNTEKRSLAIYDGDHLSILNNLKNIEFYEQQINHFLNDR